MDNDEMTCKDCDDVLVPGETFRLVGLESGTVCPATNDAHDGEYVNG